jgi:Novel toxin 21
VGAQTVFTNGKSYIVQDQTSQLRDGGWKIAKFAQALGSTDIRQATTDALLTEIGG